MIAWFTLVIRIGKDGQPLPILSVRVGEDTYHVFDGSPIKDWKPGSMVGHSTSIEIASPKGDEQ